MPASPLIRRRSRLPLLTLWNTLHASANCVLLPMSGTIGAVGPTEKRAPVSVRTRTMSLLSRSDPVVFGASDST